MKKLSRCLWMGLAVVSMLSLVGCGGKLQGEVVGSWKTKQAITGLTQIYQYKKDGTLLIKNSSFDLELYWKVEDERKGYIRQWLPAVKEENGVVYEVKFEGDTMTTRDIDGEETNTYSRVPDGTDVTEEDNETATPDAPAAPAVQMSEEDRKYIQMYTEVLTHIHAAEKAIDRFPLDPVDTVLVNARREFDAAWDLHVKYIGTPPRFYKTDSTLRLGLKKWREGLDALQRRSDKQELNLAIKLIEESKAEYEKETGVLLGKK